MTLHDLRVQRIASVDGDRLRWTLDLVTPALDVNARADEGMKERVSTELVRLADRDGEALIGVFQKNGREW